MKITFGFLVVAWFFLNLGCTSVNTRFVNPQVESPVLRGEEGLMGIGFGLIPGHNYVFTDDGSLRPPVLNDPDVENYSSLFADGTYMLTDRLQGGIEIHAMGLGVGPKLRWQALGDGAEGFQLGVYGRTGFSASTSKGDQNGEFGPGGHDWEAKTTGLSGSVGLSLGYFLKEGVLLYLGSAYGVTKAKAEIEHKLSDGGTSPAANYKVDDDGKLWSVGAGLELQFRTTILLGVTYTQIDYEKVKVEHNTQYTVGIGF